MLSSNVLPTGKVGTKLTIVPWILFAVFLGLVSLNRAEAAGFTGFYNFASWSSAATPHSGPNFATFASVDPAEHTLTLIEPEDTCCGPVEFTLSHAVEMAGTVTFDWSFNWDRDPCCSGLNFYVNGTLYNLANGYFGDDYDSIYNSDDGNSSGSFSILVNEGDVIAFGAFSADGCCDVAISTITNFMGADGCVVSGGNDECLITSGTDQSTAIDAAGGTDTLQLGGTTNFSFDVAAIGTTYTNFETFQKLDTSNVTLTGVAGTLANWDIQAGTLTASTGNNIFDTANVNIADLATFALTASETIGSLGGGAGSTVDLNGNTLTIGANGPEFSFGGVIAGTGGLTKTGTVKMILTGANTYSGLTTISAGVVNIQNANALGSTATGTTVANGAALQIQGDIWTDTEALTLNGSGVAGTGALRNISGVNVYTGTITLASAAMITADADSYIQTSGAIGGAGKNLTVGGAGVVNVDGGISTGTGTLTKVGTGTLALNSVNTFTGDVTVNAGKLQLSYVAGPVNSAIADTADLTMNGGLLNVLQNETIGSLSGATGASVFIRTDKVLTTGGNNASTTYLGATSGAGAFTKLGTGTMSTASLGHTGLTTISGGNLHVDGTIASAVVVNGGATLSGSATIAGDLTLNAGATLASGNSPGTTSVGGNYIGGGTLLTEVQFNNAAAPVNGTTHDFLDIAGNATGTTLLNVAAFAPSNAPVATTGNGIELVRVGGTANADSFQLASPVVFGAIEYALTYMADYAPGVDGYFLQGRASASMHGEAAMLAAGQALISGCLTGNDALVGDGNAHRGRMWGRASRGTRDTGADTGLDARQDYSCGSGGIDFRGTEQLRVGLSGGYGNTDSNVVTPSGIGRLAGDGGLVQLYAEVHNGNFFANLTGGYGAFDWTFDAPVGGATAAVTDGALAALQLGHTWPMGSFRLSAIGDLSYNDVDCAADCLLAGTQNDPNSLFAKATVRADATLSDGAFRPYLALALGGGGTNTVSNGPVAFETDTNAPQATAKAGATLMVGDTTALFIDGSWTEGLDQEIQAFDIGGGFKALW